MRILSLPHFSAPPFGGDDRQDHLTPAQREALAACSQRLSLRRGAVIYRAGSAADAIYNIAEGVIKTCAIAPDGVLRVMDFLSAGDLFGLTDDGDYVHTAVAITAARLYKIPLSELERLMRADPSLDICLVVKLLDELREANRRALLLGRKDALGRVAMFIGMLRRHGWGQARDRDSLYLPMTHGDIASFAGITKETLSRNLALLRKAGVIACPDRRHLRILNRAALQRLAESEFLPDPGRARA